MWVTKNRETAAEKELLFAIAKLPMHIAKAAQENRPSIVAAALFDLAKSFNRFYENCNIRDSEGAERASRLRLVRGTSVALRHGLGLLGIPALERM
jgi:arginyl-tRNA synthetase